MCIRDRHHAWKKNLTSFHKSPQYEIITNSIVTNSFEALFDITEFGTYTLLIDTPSVDSVQIIGGIGHVPDTSAYSISMVGFMLLLAGMVGVVIVGIIMVREKRKNTSS